ncbi:hypothetical protein [Amycolatopsis sp. NPDC051371]|uniref:hypothetical protein n=1 Tax=Amycolatopsis sp. NPDC051371 TaxID=3155800 RepID=UPI0034498CA6
MPPRPDPYDLLALITAIAAGVALFIAGARAADAAAGTFALLIATLTILLCVQLHSGDRRAARARRCRGDVNVDQDLRLRRRTPLRPAERVQQP